jgi:hypothetical protein
MLDEFGEQETIDHLITMQTKVLKAKKEIDLKKKLNDDLSTIIKNCSTESYEHDA